MNSSGIFKSICEDILAPCGVKVGGYKDDYFEHLYEDERDEITCQICYLIVKDPMRCRNSHLFCAACIFAWSLTSPENADRCPACRAKGAYCEDVVLSDRVGNMAIRCLKCSWKGQVSDYRIHSHGIEEVGIDPKAAGLPAVRSAAGDIVFPDIPHDDNFGATIDGIRDQHQREHLSMELELAQSQTRLSFLLDLFEEDLTRHRHNLNNLVSLQRRYNAEQFNEVMRLEAELGQITANLLRLIESADDDMSVITRRIGGNAQSRANASRPGLVSRYPDGRVPSRRESSRNNTPTHIAADLFHNHNAPTEPRNPIRRARFFQTRYTTAARDQPQQSQATTDGTSDDIVATSAASVSSSTPAPSEANAQSARRPGRLLIRRVINPLNTLANSTVGSDNSDTTGARSRASPQATERQTQLSQARNSQEITYPPRQPPPQTQPPPIRNSYEITYPPQPPPVQVLPLQALPSRARNNSHEIAYPPQPPPPQAQTQQARNSHEITYPPQPPPPPPAPPVRGTANPATTYSTVGSANTASASGSNPFTITYPPTSSSSSNITNPANSQPPIGRVSRQQIRQQRFSRSHDQDC